MNMILYQVLLLLFASDAFRIFSLPNTRHHKYSSSSSEQPYSDVSCSIVVVTSPSPMNPDITMIKSVIDSAKSMFSHNGMPKPPVIIICDGCRIVETNRSAYNGWADCKTGRVSKQASLLYEQFIGSLEVEYSQDTEVRIDKPNEHLGFALCVQKGLLSVKTTYCLVLQHGTTSSHAQRV